MRSCKCRWKQGINLRVGHPGGIIRGPARGQREGSRWRDRHAARRCKFNHFCCRPNLVTIDQLSPVMSREISLANLANTSAAAPDTMFSNHRRFLIIRVSPSKHIS